MVENPVQFWIESRTPAHAGLIYGGAGLMAAGGLVLLGRNLTVGGDHFEGFFLGSLLFGFASLLPPIVVEMRSERAVGRFIRSPLMDELAQTPMRGRDVLGGFFGFWLSRRITHLSRAWEGFVHAGGLLFVVGAVALGEPIHAHILFPLGLVMRSLYAGTLALNRVDPIHPINYSFVTHRVARLEKVGWGHASQLRYLPDLLRWLGGLVLVFVALASVLGIAAYLLPNADWFLRHRGIWLAAAVGHSAAAVGLGWTVACIRARLDRWRGGIKAERVARHIDAVYLGPGSEP